MIIIEGDAACEYSAELASVVGTGTLSLVSDREEKILGLNTIMRQTAEQTEWQYAENMLEAVAVFRLDVEKMSCKMK